MSRDGEHQVGLVPSAGTPSDSPPLRIADRYAGGAREGDDDRQWESKFAHLSNRDCPARNANLDRRRPWPP
jgi:hypothetical protein